MPSGLRQDTDDWVASFEKAKQLADDAAEIIQERNLKFPAGGPEASRLTATARKKLMSLGSSLDALKDQLESQAFAHVSESEKNRRRDLTAALGLRKESMQQSLKRDQRSANRANLLEPSSSSASPARETHATAGLENRELLQMQQHVMDDQDAELAELEKTVNSTKHIALTINEELSLHQRLLDDLDDDVEG
ncbi:hypothetical protein WJX73_002327 [Symbiochloris irregularis]|uniref:t-SNARE coiled-coil homology domain-containing protein n=1 Tax=Symbiochloris irregularis TaxID=706552 RepID=A0AAW1PAF9_9CHLO